MKSLTHETSDNIPLEDIFYECQAISKRLSQDESIDKHTKEQLFKYLTQLTEFELGRFFIKNQGALSGSWTYYIMFGFTKCPQLHPLEEAITQIPILLATRQRFQIFQSLLYKNIQSNSAVCSVPCGAMADLLTLELPEKVENVRFVGIDLDQVSLDLAKDMAAANSKSQSCQFFRENAWNLALNHREEFDIITTNGLNIYEGNDEKVIDLYQAFKSSLKPSGKLIGSAISREEEWDMSKIDENALHLQRALFVQILASTWNHFRSPEETTQQLKNAGFDSIEIYWDDAHIFYTFEAQRM